MVQAPSDPRGYTPRHELALYKQYVGRYHFQSQFRSTAGETKQPLRPQRGRFPVTPGYTRERPDGLTPRPDAPAPSTTCGGGHLEGSPLTPVSSLALRGPPSPPLGGNRCGRIRSAHQQDRSARNAPKWMFASRWASRGAINCTPTPLAPLTRRPPYLTLPTRSG